ncbi:MAG TPA: hypothetical protein VIM51_12445 [Desulfosporosinus sp.]
MTRVKNSRVSSLALNEAGCPFIDNDINVGGTAELFSSLNLGLGDLFVVR